MNFNATLIGESIAFFVFVVFTMKYVWPQLNGAIEARQKQIEEGLAASEQAEKDLELAKKEAANKLKEAKNEAAAIIEQAKKRESLIIEEAADKARAESEKILAQGQAELEAERNRARAELREQVAVLAVTGAEKIIARSIDAKAQADILDQLVEEL
ncbi:F0F1 ATP synthase subunit B [Catenovulum agarivorans DS-2]|uniref:ATP synthase subunit b n=1 Tax=Catenovulum agarivorans DS-2 TaxID=1328313 RepID=W7QN17_9ALTE|nr:F0F1 ATP synthase subunit B [Catenovulum agarivorans]EWH09288.1 F0F1 ATP synthase subunit B [Catenovulum agarivorans DS-2]